MGGPPICKVEVVDSSCRAIGLKMMPDDADKNLSKGLAVMLSADSNVEEPITQSMSSQFEGRACVVARVEGAQLALEIRE